MPRAVRIRKKITKRPSTKKHLGKSIEERPEEINNRSRFGDWEIDSVLGGKTIGEPSILTLVERQSQRESRVCQSSSLRVYETLSH